MKFSELSTDNALDAFCEVIPYLERIVCDEELVSELKKEVSITNDTTNVEKTAMVFEKLGVLTPIVLKKRRDDVLGLLAAVNSMSIEEVRKQNFIKTMLQLRELIGDKTFLDFFKSFVAMVASA